ncbi:NAD(P)-dependent oxidoreductase [Acidimangrovimonas sediminis]|uniref:NAD(P)-dependent oxidoreductase n=1 Tax=Acidimangrovimonas sediminis TaxID=2056283 RepID=UPI000C800ABB|nr:NAD(P)H-binding protein [Acidimangrovimonas sediminis]
MTKLAIFGANGYAGDAIRSEALARGHDVLAFSRSGKPRAGSANTEIATGNIHDAEAVKAVAEQVDVLVVAMPAHEIDGKKLADAIPALLAISDSTGTRLAIVGGAGSLQVSEGGPKLMEGEKFPPIALPEATAHGEMLALLRGADKGRWFYLSPAMMFGAHAPQEPVGAYTLGGDVMIKDSRGMSAIGDKDYAKAFLDEIDTPAHENQRFSVIGAY